MGSGKELYYTFPPLGAPDLDPSSYVGNSSGGLRALTDIAGLVYGKVCRRLAIDKATSSLGLHYQLDV